MYYEDLESGGFFTLSRLFAIASMKQAQRLDKFLDTTSDFQEAFEVAGPGTYYVHVDRGWDRVGGYSNLLIKKIPNTHPATVPEFFRELKRLKAIADYEAEPFAVLRDIGRGAERYAQASDEEKAIASRASAEKYTQTKDDVVAYLEGEK